MAIKLSRVYQTDTEEERIWLVVYSDMITNLMLFFLMLYGLSRMSIEDRQNIIKGMEQKFRGRADVEMRAERVLKDVKEQNTAIKVKNLIEAQDMKENTSVVVNESQIRITLNVPVLFRSGEAELTDSAKVPLNAVARILSGIPNKVIIEGHTDNKPVLKTKYLSNWELSVARAYSVIEYFINEKGLDSSRFIAAGYGEYRPVASNETQEGQAKNRRIEIVMVRESK